MNREQIIQMAREAGFFIQKNEIYSMSTQSDQELTEWIERFAKLVAEHCAKICEDNWHECGGQCAHVIRYGDKHD
jgi:hypothetical protein